METYQRDWDTNGFKAHASKQGIVIENWNINQGCLTDRKVLIVGGSMPTDDDWMLHLDKLRYAEEIDNVRILRKGHFVR